MAQRLVLSIVLQDIIKNKDGMPASGYWMYFYDKRSPTTLRNAYYKNQEGNVVPAPNPLQLDENGALPHKLYYFVDVDDPEDRYTVELKCCYGNAAAPELIFQDLPYFQEQAKADPITAIVSDNLFIDGQFNIGLQIDDRGQGAGFILPTFSQLPIAGLSWQFLRLYADSVPVQNRVDVDRIFIKEINEAEKISEGNPRFYLNVICEKFNEKTPPLQKIVAFRSSNVLWGANTNIQLKFYAWKSGDNIPLAVSVIRNFGERASAAPQVIQIAEYTIDSDVPKVYFTNLALPAVIIPKGIGDDQYLLVQFSLPKNQRFDFRATNFYCAEVSSPVSVVDFKYPVRNADLAKSDLLFSSFLPNKYGIHDSYKKLIFTIGGLKFADDIGEIVRYPKGAKVDEKKTNLIKCDGRMLDANGISHLGIEYKRLYEKLGCTPSTFNILQTEEKPGWFNAISSKYIKKFVADKSVKVAFSGKGTVNPKPEGDGIADLWIETTFHANQAVDYNFQYVVSNVGENMEIITCCHSFDISISYIGSGLFSTSNGLQWVNFAGSETNFPGYFYTETGLNLIDRIDGGKVTYSKGIDEVTKKTRAYYSVKDGFFYLTINLNNQQCEYPSGLCGFFSPVNFSNRVYNVGFPLTIPQGSATFLQPNISNTSISQNYFLFSPWYVNSISLVHGTGVSSSRSRYPTHLLGQRDGSKVKDVPIKSWDNHVIYKQSPEEGRSPGNPSILFADKNSVITYAMQHKALFTQRCLYAIKLNKGGNWDPLGAIGLKRYDNTDSDYVCDLVIWWNVLGNDDTPHDNIKAKEYIKLEVNGKETTEELADAIANAINSKGATMFDIPHITDPEDKYEYYIRY